LLTNFGKIKLCPEHGSSSSFYRILVPQGVEPVVRDWSICYLIEGIEFLLQRSLYFAKRFNSLARNKREIKTSGLKLKKSMKREKR